jgi:hypothetical protein
LICLNLKIDRFRVDFGLAQRRNRPHEGGTGNVVHGSHYQIGADIGQLLLAACTPLVASSMTKHDAN